MDKKYRGVLKPKAIQTIKKEKNNLIIGDEKYEDNPLIATFDLDTEGTINNISNANSIVIYSIIALAIVTGIIFIYKKRLKLITNKKSKIWILVKIG